MNGVSEGDRASRGEIIPLWTEDGTAQIRLRADEGTGWLTQAQMAEMFPTTKQNVSLHVRRILADGIRTADSTIKEYLTVQTEGTREIRRVLIVYWLVMILAVRCRLSDSLSARRTVPRLGHDGTEGVPRQGPRDARRAPQGSECGLFRRASGTDPGCPCLGGTLLTEGP